MTRTRSFRFALQLERLEARDVPSFLLPVAYPVGTEPEDVAVADVDGDGRRDVVVAVAGDDNVAVLLGNGNGTLQTPVNYTVDDEPYGVRVADLNGDAKPDIVTANFTGKNVSVLLNNGNGTFLPAQHYGASMAYAFKVAVGDVDGDAIPDVAVSNFNGFEVWVLHGNGDGTLLPPEELAVHFASQNVQITDLDGDGVGDITVDSEIGFVDTWYGTGANASYQAGGCWGHTVADLNKDGWPDLTVARWNSKNVSVLLNRGDGTFDSKMDFPIGETTVYPVVADFNRDRKPDIAVTYYHPENTLSVVLGNGDGTFKHPAKYAAGQVAFIAAAGDLNHDRYADLVVADASGTVNVLLNDGVWAPPIPARRELDGSPGYLTECVRLLKSDMAQRWKSLCTRPTNGRIHR